MDLMTMQEEVIQQDTAYILGTYPRMPLVFVRGQGMWLYDQAGRPYLDFTSGIAVNALGHADPQIVAAVQEQTQRLSHVSNLYYTLPQIAVAKLLCDLSFADKVFFCNSGAEAVEAALKFARKYARIHFGEGKTRVLAFSQGFHGRTMGALAVTAREKYQAPFRPLMPDVDFAAFNDLAAAAQAITGQTCAVIFEPVQGEGGVIPADPAFVSGLRQLCDSHGALLIADEIQCGLGRTGQMWGYQHTSMQPDLLTVAKSLAGGLPMGAVLLAQRVADTVAAGDHGSTFAGGPVVARAAEVVLERVRQPEFLAHVVSMGSYVVQRLKSIPSPHILEVRGRGLMVGILLDCEAKPIVDAAIKQGLLLLNAGENVLRLLPPLIVGEAEIDQMINILTTLLA
jgi:acetylornithine/N-succinyldiaminopimelate aminotransferase